MSRHRRSDLLDHARDLVAEDLRMLGERPDAPELVTVVVRVSGDDVQIGAAQAHRLHANDDLVRRRLGARHLAHLDAVDVDEHRGAHGHLRDAWLVGDRGSAHGAP